MTPAASLVAGHPWDDAAEGWSRHTGLIRPWLREATEAMLQAARIAPGDHVLDVAAGAGDQTLDIARRVGPTGTVLATDVSARILELARQTLLAAGMTQVRTLQADAQALGLEARGLANANFNAAVCRLGLMFCTEPSQALCGIRSALAPGGRISALVFARPQANPCITVMMQTACRHAGVGPADPFAPGSLLSLGCPGRLEGLLHAAGFVAIEVRPLSAPFKAASCAEYVAFVQSAGSPVIEVLKPLTAAARAAAWADITQALQRFSTASGWEGPNELLLCSAVNP
jgi:ubiquinone/menaquinone biosynthesis C-methylase UbiE